MDPTETLKIIRDGGEKLEELELALWDGPNELTADKVGAYVDATNELRGHMEALDNWMTGGGFMPEQWRALRG